jgi:hypothetical protein
MSKTYIYESIKALVSLSVSREGEAKESKYLLHDFHGVLVLWIVTP